mmetsp:Transcript_22047/g.66161  ORF Transcript_22047/g.66161 Transcript_22047/m.66161 type:complete len:291 (-) Transcript_22047:33-905(-)
MGVFYSRLRRPRTAESAPKSKSLFPGRLAPELVLEWLPLPDIATALRSCSLWRRAAESTFRSIALQNNGFVGPRYEPPAQRCIGRPRWDRASQFDDEAPFLEFERSLSGVKFDEGSAGIRARDDFFIVGCGWALRHMVHGCMFDVLMSREESFTDACGFALLDAASGDLLLGFIWNSSGDTYNSRPQWICEIIDGRAAFEEEAHLKVCVRVVGRQLHAMLWVKPGGEKDPRSFTQLSRAVVDLAPGTTHEKLLASVASNRGLAAPGDLAVAPFCRMFGGSAATLLAATVA